MGGINEVGLLEVTLSFLHVLSPMAFPQESSCSELTIVFSVTIVHVKKGNKSEGANVLQHKPLLLPFSKKKKQNTFKKSTSRWCSSLMWDLINAKAKHLN